MVYDDERATTWDVCGGDMGALFPHWINYQVHHGAHKSDIHWWNQYSTGIKSSYILYIWKASATSIYTLQDSTQSQNGWAGYSWRGRRELIMNKVSHWQWLEASTAHYVNVQLPLQVAALGASELEDLTEEAHSHDTLSGSPSVGGKWTSLYWQMQMGRFWWIFNKSIENLLLHFHIELWACV